MTLVLTPKTTMGTLLGEHPFLLGYLADYHPEFKKLTNPVARRTVARLATMERVAANAGIPTEKLLGDIAAEIERQTGARPQVGATTAAGTDPARQAELKSIISELHAGRSAEEVKPRFEALIKDVEPTEIAAMEQALMDEGVPDTEVKRLCDVHMKVFEDALDANPALCVPEGHPVDVLQRENQALVRLLDDSAAAADAGALVRLGTRLAEFERHYVRKENQLFPALERHGVEGPSKVMWALHDDIRTVMKELRRATEQGDQAAARRAADEVGTMMRDMVSKEEKILFPMALDVLSEEEWRQIRAGDDEVGYALLEEVPSWSAAGGGEGGAPGTAAGATAGRAPRAAAGTTAPGSAEGDVLTLHTGELSPEQLDLLIGRLPLDLTFVDENDQVRFYSEGERVFPRSPGVIGRKVQNCHPPASVHKVQQIVEAFRRGEKDVAEFWIEMEGRFIHIRYFALRDGDGTYRGVLETVQDVTGIRALEGERRLLDW